MYLLSLSDYCKWYTLQRPCVKWGNVVSSSFTVPNSLRQGNILSLTLFNVYLEDLSKLLCKCDVGCDLLGVCYNHLVYVDDCVLLTTSPNALQILLKMCHEFADNNELVYNEATTKSMVFKLASLKD